MPHGGRAAPRGKGWPRTKRMQVWTLGSPPSQEGKRIQYPTFHIPPPPGALTRAPQGHRCQQAALPTSATRPCSPGAEPERCAHPRPVPPPHLSARDRPRRGAPWAEPVGPPATRGAFALATVHPILERPVPQVKGRRPGSARGGGYDATRVAAASFDGSLGLAPGPADRRPLFLAARATRRHVTRSPRGQAPGPPACHLSARCPAPLARGGGSARRRQPLLARACQDGRRGHGAPAPGAPEAAAESMGGCSSVPKGGRL